MYSSTMYFFSFSCQKSCSCQLWIKGSIWFVLLEYKGSSMLLTVKLPTLSQIHILGWQIYLLGNIVQQRYPFINKLGLELIQKSFEWITDIYLNSKSSYFENLWMKRYLVGNRSMTFQTFIIFISD